MIQVGDTVYVWREGHGNDFSRWQVRATVVEIKSVPRYGSNRRRRQKLFTCRDDSGERVSSYQFGLEHGSWGRRFHAIRKTPFPDLEIRESRGELEQGGKC